jgi:hypothetical protein
MAFSAPRAGDRFRAVSSASRPRLGVPCPLIVLGAEVARSTLAVVPVSPTGAPNTVGADVRSRGPLDGCGWSRSR